MVTMRAAPLVRTPPAELLYPAVVFTSAFLVFTLEPLVARLVLPVLGGSPAVWNTSLAFFQAALLLGYVYAHLLQRLRTLRAQVLTHLTVLVLAALVLPLRITSLLGEPAPGNPALWLLGVLALSIGAPFAALSATAPLLQAWHARSSGGSHGARTWSLYAASNIGSLLALLAYPTLIEPTASLRLQSAGWTVGYLCFLALVGAVGWSGVGRDSPASPLAEGGQASVRWLDRARWVVLAAIPSSLLLGVTSFVTVDIASAPFLWVVPLALYLLSFVVAFQARPVIPPGVALGFQAVTVTAACLFIHVRVGLLLLGVLLHFTAFFFTALVCHQALAARRPSTAHLTDFYVCVSLGGVVGGAFNAFVAPQVFRTILEYPAVLALSALARPWTRGRPTLTALALLAACAAAGLGAVELLHPLGRPFPRVPAMAIGEARTWAFLLLGLAAIGALALQSRGRFFCVALAMLVAASGRAADRVDVIHTWRDFFGVLRESELTVPALGGRVHMLANGTTLHGAQARSAAFRCRPIVYYAPQTPIGQVFATLEARRPAIDAGVVGLGTGALAAYSRPGDTLRFFEIDPLVARIATDPANFSYVRGCARGAVAITLGDARLTLSRVPAGVFDVLVIDAFSSDSVPAHLLTVEAMRIYLAHLKPGGVLVLHLSNRNLDLMRPAQAAVLAAGGFALAQEHKADPALPLLWESSENAVIATRTPLALLPFAADARWRPADPQGVAPWTDDHTDLFGALVRRTAARFNGAAG
jgi:SAM-dependent methyltransferase